MQSDNFTDGAECTVVQISTVATLQDATTFAVQQRSTNQRRSETNTHGISRDAHNVLPRGEVLHGCASRLAVDSVFSRSDLDAVGRVSHMESV